MWIRADLKQRAKETLRRNYWKAFVISIIIAFAIGLGGSSTGSAGNRVNSNNFTNIDNYGNQNFYSSYYGGQGNVVDTIRNGVFQNLLVLITSAVVISIFIISKLLGIFLGYHLEVGGRKFYIQAALGEDNMSYLKVALRSECYFKVIGTMIMRSIFTFLWTLLFVIPGIIKGYAYSMTPYILADNPEIGYKRALELSMSMTKGHKMSIFVLDLSFLGWRILGFLACFVGTFFVLPYIDATYAELYLCLRRNALESGITCESELNMRLQ